MRILRKNHVASACVLLLLIGCGKARFPSSPPALSSERDVRRLHEPYEEAIAPPAIPTENAEHYRRRAAVYYEREHLLRATSQVSIRANLMQSESVEIGQALRAHIDRYLDRYYSDRCLTRHDWDELTAEFDADVAKRLPQSKAALVKAWRISPWPQGNALGSLFGPNPRLEPLLRKAAADDAVDCGYEPRSGRSCQVDACVVSAVKRLVPFRAAWEPKLHYSREGDRGMVGMSDGTGLVLELDANGVYTQRPCTFVIVKTAEGDERVDCATEEPREPLEESPPGLWRNRLAP